MRRVSRSRILGLSLLLLGASACQRGSQQPAAQTSPPASPPGETRAAGAPPLPPGHPAVGEPGRPFAVAPPPKEAGRGASALRWAVPRGWVPESPSSGMRKAQYRVPGPGGDAECVVSYFGPGEGGDALSNANRWASQFRQTDGKPAPVPQTREINVRGIKVLLVEVKGTYVGGLGTGPSSQKPGYMLVGAVAEGPDANWFFKLTGPEATVSSQRSAFEGMIRSLSKGA